MPLYLATHTVEVVTAKVPLTMIMLMDHVKQSKTAIPPELRPRVVLPTGSTVSISLWDAPAADVLLAWLNENLQYDATHDVHEVQEEFVWGLGFELARVRAADKVAAGSRGALDRISATAHKASVGIQHQVRRAMEETRRVTGKLEALDQRSGILTAAESAINRIRSVATTTTTSGSPAPGSTGDAEGYPPAEGADVPPPAPTTDAQVPTTSAVLAANMSAGFSKASSTFSWLGSAIKEQITKGTSTVAGGRTNSQPPADPTQPPPAYSVLFPGGTTETASGAGGGAVRTSPDDEDAPLASLDTLPQLPVSLPPQAPGGANTPLAAGAAVKSDEALTASNTNTAPSFTLDDSEDTTAPPAK